MASPWGAFLAELPFKAASVACCRHSATDEGRSLFFNTSISNKRAQFLLMQRLPLGGESCRRSATDEGRRLFLDFPNIFDKKFLKIKRRDLFSI